MNEIVYSPTFRTRFAAELAARADVVASLPAAWFKGGVRILEAVHGTDLRPELGRIACPTLVITAGLDALMPTERSVAVAAAIAGAEHVLVAGCGHALVVEERIRFLDLVKSFLDRCKEPGHSVLRSP
jgi:3-oxoadipate enol-lactonase